MSIHKKIKKILSFVLGFAMIVMQTPPCSAEKLYVAAGDVTYIVNEDFEGDDYLWKSSTTERREFGDSVNPTTYLKTVSGYTTLSEGLTGNIIIEFMAKGTGSYFSFTTRQNSNYLKTITSTFRPSFVNDWGYYRVVLDCENLTGKVYSSQSSFTEMVEMSQTVTFTDADGFNQITFRDCYLDNLRILNQPVSGSFCSTVKNGQQDANIENGIEFLFYEPMNKETFTDANIQLVNTTDDADEMSLENVGMFGFKVVPSYSSIYNKSFECTLSDNIKNSENSAITVTELSFSTSMKKFTDSVTVESHSLTKGGEELTAFDSESGDIAARLVLTNNEDAANTFAIVTALFKNTGEADILESYSVTDVTLDGEAKDISVDTSALTVPEHNAGDYSIKIFIWDSLAGRKPLAEQINYNAVTQIATEETDEATAGLALSSQVDNENGEFTITGKIATDTESRIGYTVIDNTGNLVYLGQLLNKLGKAQFEQTVVLNTGALSGTYTISAKDTSGLMDEDSFDVNTANIKPRAIDVYISGNPVEKDFIKAEYKIHHINTEAADVSEFRWYSATTEEGPYTLIQGANERTYELGEEDVGLYIKCAVIPKLEGIIPGDEEKSLEAVKVSALPTVENLTITGAAESGEVLTANFETFIGYDGLRIEWLRSDSENGQYMVIDEESSYTYTVRDADESYYIMFKLYKGEKYLKSSTPVHIVNSMEPKEITYIVNEDFEGDDYLWKSSTSERREFGDSVNPTTYLKTVSGYTTLSKGLTGNIIIEFMAKGTGSSFSFTTRQDSNYLKTITSTFNPSFVNDWGYYRVVLDCENLTGKVYSSQSSFTEMVETSQTVTFKDADGFNQITFSGCYLDNLRILNQPVSGSFYSSVINGQENANIENGIEFLFYEPMNTETETTVNVELVNTTDNLSEKTVENIGIFGFKVVPSYTSIYNKSFECTLSENIKNSENTAIAKTKLSFSTSMKKITDSVTVESHSLIKGGEELTAFDSESGDIAARLVLTNNEDATNTFAVVMALFKNVGDKEIFENYSVSNVTLNAEAKGISVDTSALTVPEHNAGDYSIKIFIWDSLAGRKPLAEQINYNVVAKIATEETDEAAAGLTLSSQVDNENGEFTITGKIATDKESRIGYTVKDPEGKVIYLGQALNQLVKAQFMQTVILNTGALSGTYTLSAKDTSGLENVYNFSVNTANIKPRALDVHITGNPVMGSEIKIQYTIFHPNINGSDASEFRWYRASEKDGGYTQIPDANEITYTLTNEDAAKYIKCAVIPKFEGVSQTGNEVRSEGVRITARPVATNLSIKGSVKEGQTVTADYNYYDADGKGETSATVVTWYVDGSAVSTGATYTIPSGYAGKKLCFTVTPGADGANGSGDPVTSNEVTISSAGSGGSGGGGGGGKQVSISGDIAVQPTPVETVKPIFSDIENHWAKDIIEKLNKEGIINGKSEGKFDPDSSITRAEYAALIVRIAKLTTEDRTEKFSDVSSDSWYFDVVNAAKQHGLIDGFEGAFRPDDSITRQEATAIIYRLCKLIGKKAEGDKSPIQFADGTDIAQWALEGIEFSTQAGIILGDENNNFRPNANLSRAEAAAILSRI